MKTVYAAVIGCDISTDYFQNASINKLETFHWKKVFTGSSEQTIFHGSPNTEFVSSVDAILNDEDISLVFVSANHLEFAKQMIEAGKAVRVI